MGTPTEFREVMRLVFDGTFSPVVQEVLTLDETRRGHEILEKGNVSGKLAIVP